MRMLRFMLCAVMLAVCAQAQQSSFASPSPGNEQQEPGQTPENPLEEPKPVDPQATGESRPAMLETQAAPGQDQVLGEVRLMTRWTQLNGDKTRSFREEDSNNLAEFNFFSDRGFFVTRRIQVLSMYRGTDDRSIDPEHNSVQRGYVRIFGPRDEYIFGDALVNFSRMSFNQNIKGVSVTHKLGEDWKVTGVGGIFIDRYGSLYKELSGRPYMAAVTGLRAEYQVLRDSFLGFNYSMSSDQLGTLPRFTDAGNLQPAIPATNKLGTIDMKMQGTGIRMEGELAYSFTDFDRRFAPAGIGSCTSYNATTGGLDVIACDSRKPQQGLGVQGDWGARLEGSWRHRRLSVRSSYVRYQPNFASLNARQVADLQDFVGRVSYDVSDWLTVDGTVRRSNNDLREQERSIGGYQTVLWGPEARAVLHDMEWFPRGTVEFGLRYRDIASSDNTSVDRTVRIPFIEVTVPVAQAFFTAGYEKRNVRDHVNVSQFSNTDRVYAGVRGMFDIGNWLINPTLRFELERMNHRPALTSTPADSTLLHDINRLGSVALFVEAPRYVIMELGFRSSSATISTLELDAVNPLIYARNPAGYSRPQYRGALTYKITNDENKLFIFSFERNNNYYVTSPNYDERVWAGTLVYRFGRRAQ